MATIDITNETFAQTIQDNDMVLVDAWAEWCGACRQFAPIFEKASEDHKDVVFAKLDTEANQEISAALGIQSIPTLFLFREGILIFQQPGALPPAAIEDVLKQALVRQPEPVEWDEAAEEAAAAARLIKAETPATPVAH